MAEAEFTVDRKKIIVSRIVDGKKVYEDRFDPVSARSRQKVAVALGVTEDWLMDRIADRTAQPHPDPVRVTIPETAPVTATPVATGLDVTVRPLDKSRAESGTTTNVDPRAFLQNDLEGIPVSDVIEWDGFGQLCCLDIDYHDGTPVPDREWLDALVRSRLSPQPYAWHFSRGGGLHLFYLGDDTFTGDDLAAVAALRFRAIDSSAGLELKHVVRGPGAEPVYCDGRHDNGSTVLGEWFAAEGTDEEARDRWLESEGMELGQRYDHSKCPICPTPDEPGAKRDPVLVSENGVMCFVCQGKGRALGCRRPGFASWGAILGAPASGDVGVMIRRITNWGHARWVLTEKYGMPEPLAKRAYRAALKSFHADKDTYNLIPGAFNEITGDLTRSNNQWMNLKASYQYTKDIDPILGLLPVAQRYDGEKDAVRADPAAVSLLTQGMDLTDWGFPNVDSVHGFKIAAQFLPNVSGRTQVAVPNPELVRRSPRYVPRYVRPSERMSEDAAWAIIESVVPRIDRTLIKTAICAFGSAQETRAGLTPIVFVSGPSGAAKTSTIMIAAGIYGTKVQSTIFNADTDRFYQSLFAGAQSGPAVMLNELIKDAARSRGRLTPREALDPILNLTPDSSSHALYRGPVRFGRVPSIWVTEPKCPLMIRDETQLARRIRHHEVEGRKDEWKDTLAAAQLFDLHLIRLVSDRVNDACNAIVSHVCDEFFCVPTTWDEQANRLGVKTIEDDSGFDDTTPQLREFFRLVAEAPALEGRLAKLYGTGYKRVHRNGSADDETDLVNMYSFFADAAGGPDWLKARKLQEKDWSAILKTDRVVQFDMKDDGASVYVRFRQGPSRQPAAVNGDIKIGVELP